MTKTALQTNYDNLLANHQSLSQTTAVLATTINAIANLPVPQKRKFNPFTVFSYVKELLQFIEEVVRLIKELRQKLTPPSKDATDLQS